MGDITLKNIGSTGSLEQEKWQKEHISLNRGFVEEAIKAKIYPGSIAFWVYHKHREYEEFGKYGYCVAGTSRLGDELGLTNKQIINAYAVLMAKGLIAHVWCDQKVYRNKTRLYISKAKAQLLNVEIDERNLVKGNARKLETAVDKGAVPYGIKISGGTDDMSGETDLNSYKNSSNNNYVKSSDLTSLFNKLRIQLKLSDKYKLSEKRKSQLRRRLAEFTEDELLAAAVNLSESEFHMGDNPNRKKYASIDFLLNSYERAEKWVLVGEEREEKPAITQEEMDAIRKRQEENAVYA